MNALSKPQSWPELRWEQWRDTADTLHMFLQIIGKTRLALTPVQNHWWNVPLYVTARGVSTSVMALLSGGTVDIEIDFVAHEVVVRRDSGQTERMVLGPQPGPQPGLQTVAGFYSGYQALLAKAGVEVEFDSMPVEVKDPIRFDLDTAHRSYDREAVHRFWRALTSADTLLKQFSTNFYGKISPVHFFWGSFDLAVTRFNGKRAPARPGADAIQSEAYSHECISAGFWPGNGGYGQAAFYTYAAPVPEGLAEAEIGGPGRFDSTLGEFVLNYADLRASENPGQTVLDFLGSAYSAAADSAHWDRASLDRTDSIGAAAVLLRPHAHGLSSHRG